ncbi:MAG: hypothetical protein IPN26_01260 [Bacteroidetes bacterium]|nr:hypothetical protein [Bacteroidota bacterium]
MLFSTCRKKRLVGQVTFSGQVKDSYSQKAMANIQIGVGEFSSNWLGQFYYLKEITVTDQDGRYYLTDTLRIIQLYSSVFWIVLRTIHPHHPLGALFLLNPESDKRDDYLIYKPVFAKSNQQTIDYSLDRLSRVQYHLKKSMIFPSDSITFFGFQYLPMRVYQDTTVFVKLKPRSTNQVEIKRGNDLIYQEQFNIGTSGDTIYREVQL